MPKRPEPWWREDRQAWFVQIDGKRHNLGPDEKAAWQCYYELMAQPAKRTTVRSRSLLAIIDAYLGWCQDHRAPDTYEWYRFRLQNLAEWLDATYPKLTATDLREFHVDEWLATHAHLASGSRHNYGRSIKRTMRWAKKKGHIESNPIADMELPKPGKREVVVSEEQYRDVLGVVPDRGFRDLVKITWETGCRPQESLRVEARHVDIANQRWIFPVSESKTDIPRVVYLTDAALDITKRLMVTYREGPLFRNTHGEPWKTEAVNCAFTRVQVRLGRKLMDEQRNGQKDRRRKYLAVDDTEVARFIGTLNPCKQSGRKKTDAELRGEARRKLTHAAAVKLGPKYSLYALRHTWMNRLLVQGVDSLTVAFLSGHTDPSTLAKHYAHLSQNPGYLLDQVKRVAG